MLSNNNRTLLMLGVGVVEGAGALEGVGTGSLGEDAGSWRTEEDAGS